MPHEVGLLARSMIQSLVASQSSNRPSFVEDLSGRLQRSPRATSLEIGLEPVGLLTFAIPHHLAAGRVHVLRACLRRTLHVFGSSFRVRRRCHLGGGGIHFLPILRLFVRLGAFPSSSSALSSGIVLPCSFIVIEFVAG